MIGDTPYSHLSTMYQVALLVGALVIAVGAALMNKQKGGKKKGKSKKKATVSSTVMSPKQTRKIAKNSGSVATPSGRRSARLARKSLN